MTQTLSTLPLDRNWKPSLTHPANLLACRERRRSIEPPACPEGALRRPEHLRHPQAPLLASDGPVPVCPCGVLCALRARRCSRGHAADPSAQENRPRLQQPRAPATAAESHDLHRYPPSRRRRAEAGPARRSRVSPSSRWAWCSPPRVPRVRGSRRPCLHLRSGSCRCVGVAPRLCFRGEQPARNCA